MTALSGSETVVEVRNLNKSFGKLKAVDNVSFTFRSGEVHGFIGPNGAGKTTTMRSIATLDMPDSGDVYVNGISVINFPDQVRPVLGFMPDYLDSYRDMNVREYLDYFARAYRLPPKRRRQRMTDVIEFTGLTDMLYRPVTKLSKGMKQRLSLGRVLINDPQVLILDEPAAGLDPRARVELRRLVRLLADRGKAVFISSHILTELSAICDGVTIIEHGVVQVSDSVDAIHQRVNSGVRVQVNLLNADEAEMERLLRTLAEEPAVVSSEAVNHGVQFIYSGDHSCRSKLLKRLMAENFTITDFHATASDLEDAFMALTKGQVS